MGIREFLDGRRQSAVGILTVLIIVVFGYTLLRATNTAAPVTNARAFYTDDDGKSWFADDFAKPFPFDHNGKQAYQASVARCGKKEPAVAYLTRFDDDSLKLVRELYAKRDENWPMKFEALQRNGLQVKKPGDTNWMPIESAAGQTIVENAFKCSDGSAADVVVP